MANYWIKLYIEILNDSKMAVLPDRLWRRVIEMFLAAGNYDDEGNLPDTQQLAWLLRMSTDDLEMDLKQIATTGIIQRTDKGWVVTKYAQRQAPVPGAERVRQFRQRQKKQQYYGDVTQAKRDVTQNTDTESYTDTEVQRLQTAFINASGIPDFGTNGSESIEIMLKAGVTPDDITEAVRTLQAKKYTIKGINSVEKTAINIAKQRTAVPIDNRNVPTEEY